MIRNYFLGMVASGLMLVSMQAPAATPDYVTDVYLCGPNIIQIFLKSGIVLEADFTDSTNMTAGLFNQIYAMGLELLASGKQVGYYNNLKTETSCGRSGVIEINAFMASSTP